MNPTKIAFIKLCIATQALRFGEFTLKSGRRSPYFFDVARFNRGDLLSQLARHYARLLADQLPPPASGKTDFMLYGPAYKGIALAAATAMQLAERHDLKINYAFHRKEAKQHGEGGSLLGAELRGKVVIIDDVITAATSIRQAVAAIEAARARAHAVVVALDREEIADSHANSHDSNGGGKSAAQQVQDEFGIAVHALLTLNDLLDYVTHTKAAAEHRAAIAAYRKRYGVA